MFKKKNNSGSINHLPTPTAITIGASKVGLQKQRSDALKDDGEGTWCKYVCCFPELKTYGEKYHDRQNTMKRKMEEDRIPGWRAVRPPNGLPFRHVLLPLFPLQLGWYSVGQILPGVNVLLNALIFR